MDSGPVAPLASRASGPRSPGASGRLDRRTRGRQDIRPRGAEVLRVVRVLLGYPRGTRSLGYLRNLTTKKRAGDLQARRTRGLVPIVADRPGSLPSEVPRARGPLAPSAPMGGWTSDPMPSGPQVLRPIVADGDSGTFAQRPPSWAPGPGPIGPPGGIGTTGPRTLHPSSTSPPGGSRPGGPMPISREGRGDRSCPDGSPGSRRRAGWARPPRHQHRRRAGQARTARTLVIDADPQGNA